MRNHVSRIGVSGVVGMLALVTVGLSAQSPRPDVIQVSGPRPLDLVVSELQRRHGRVITYEDPVRVNAADLKDVTETIPVNKRQGRQHFVPRGGPFTFSYKPPVDVSDESLRGVLTMLVQQYNRISPDAQFRVSQTGSMFHIVPSTRRSPNGQVQPAPSPLDAFIEVPDGPRPAVEQLFAIGEGLRNAGYGIGIGIASPKALPGNVAGGVHSETARAALAALLNSSPFKMSWGLLCSPGPEVSCMLNLRPLAK